MIDSVSSGIIGVAGTISGSILTFILNTVRESLSERKNKKAKKEENKKLLRNKSLEILDLLTEAYFINYEIFNHFSNGYCSATKIENNLDSYLDVISKTKPFGNLPKKIKIQKYKEDVLSCSGINAYNQFTMIDGKLNSPLACAKEYKKEYISLFDQIPGKKKIDGDYVSIVFSKEDFEKFEENSHKIHSMFNYITCSIDYSSQNLEYIKILIEKFINGEKFPIDDFAVELMGSGDEGEKITIKKHKIEKNNGFFKKFTFRKLNK